ncbi:C-C chemokine receptor type 1-like [Sander vitreus]
MSDEGEHATTIADYSSYYDKELPDFAPCSNTDLKAFGKVFLPTLYSLVFILGFLGNGLVVCVLVKHRNQTNLTDICLFNLALSDLLFVLTLPFYSHYSVVRQWTFGDFMCRFTSGSHNTGFFSSIFFMIVMTLDRYVVIMHTQKVARYRTVRLSIAMTVFVWMLSLCVSLPVIIFTKVTNDSQEQTCSYVPNDAWKSYHTLTINVLGLMIPLLVMIVCYSRIIPILVNMRSAKKHRVVKLIVSIVMAFFIFWAPYNISLLLMFLKSEGVLPTNCNMESNLRLSVTVTETFAYTHCCLNPIIYAFVGQKFMKRALQLLRKWMPGIFLPSNRDLSDSSYRKSSNVSRSSDVTSNLML